MRKMPPCLDPGTPPALHHAQKMLRSIPHCPTCHKRSISSSSSDTEPSTVQSNSSTKSPNKLGMSGVANLFVRARRAENRLPSRQRQQAQQKPGQIIFTSGEPQTHPGIECSMQPDQLRVPVEFAESYVCSGGVNVVPLLVATRAALRDRAEAALGAGTLTDEQWECIISGPKSQTSGIYKVQVRYMACATRSSARLPRHPVCVDQARGIPGLMTIIKRCVD